MNREEFFQLVTPHIEWLNHFVLHLIRYAEADMKLIQNELDSEEVVDAALIRAYQWFLKDVSVGDVRSWLTYLAVDTLEQEITQLVTMRQRAPVHIEDDIPETPPQEEVWQLGEEILDFYQPDEDLKVEDVIADSSVETPEEQFAAQEMRECVGRALRDMPEDWRRILLMSYGDDTPAREIALSVGRPEREVHRILSYSSKYVRQRLIESGCTLTTRRAA